MNRDFGHWPPRPVWQREMETIGWLLVFCTLVLALGFILFWWAPAKLQNEAQASAETAIEQHCLTRPRKPSPFCEGGIGDE